MLFTPGLVPSQPQDILAYEGGASLTVEGQELGPGDLKILRDFQPPAGTKPGGCSRLELGRCSGRVARSTRLGTVSFARRARRAPTLPRCTPLVCAAEEMDAAGDGEVLVVMDLRPDEELLAAVRSAVCCASSCPSNVRLAAPAQEAPAVHIAGPLAATQGLAREVVNRVQRLRKKAGLQATDAGALRVLRYARHATLRCVVPFAARCLACAACHGQHEPLGW